MASGGSKSAAFMLLLLNLESSRVCVGAVSSGEDLPYILPGGEHGDWFFVIFSLIAGVVGMATSLTGIMNVLEWDSPNLHSAAASSLISCLKPNLNRFGLVWCCCRLACKEINIGWTEANLRTLEVMTIIVSATHLLCTGAIHVGVGETVAGERLMREELSFYT
ncbi:AWPM-19-like family protein [Raphanus sativus]|nr:AWPM-19-like family protein [Raphanus sativus]